jgi:hypothetical protein
MAKSDNLEIDFDSFTDEELDEITKPTIQPLNIIATIKYGNHWYSEDVAYLSSDEFVDWILQIFPITTEAELRKNDLNNRAVRSQLVDQITDFYTRPMFPKPSEWNKGF